MRIKNFMGKGKVVSPSFSDKTCVICSENFTPNSGTQKTCSSECRRELWKENKRKYYKRHSKKIYKRQLKYLPKRLARQKAMRVYKKLGINKCELCQSDYKTEVHHIDFNVFNNKRNNLVMLCRNCHVSQHVMEKASTG